MPHELFVGLIVCELTWVHRTATRSSIEWPFTKGAGTQSATRVSAAASGRFSLFGLDSDQDDDTNGPLVRG